MRRMRFLLSMDTSGMSYFVRSFLLFTSMQIAHPFTGHSFSLVEDEATLTAIFNKEVSSVYSKDVICRYCKAPPSGDRMAETILGHLKSRHGVDEKDVKRRVHWSWKVDTPFDCLHPQPVKLDGV
ncbi:hypothetical protein L218DRAFT_714650 [Marasmius fiardii PR-910]|nr:hypothetical protein L218DRAFT_714650 [Marasmius fiardii PR-910]